MPKGKILMGKGPIKRPEPVKPKPKGEKKRALPMPKPKPGKPAPKGDKVFERNPGSKVFERNPGSKVIEKARSIVDVILPGKPGEARQSMPSFLRKTKPVQPKKAGK